MARELLVTTDDVVLLSALVDDAERRAESHGATGAAGASRSRGAAAALNSTVEFENIGSGERARVVLVHPAEADAGQGRISVLSPVGRALLGSRAGHEVEVALPSGETRRMVILGIAEGGGR
jgi:transcription elongation GreA/GreB family factor